MSAHMEKGTRQITIMLEGRGYKYSLFEVKAPDIDDLLGNDQGVFLRNRFRRYAQEDALRESQGMKSRMIQFYTLLDDSRNPATLTIIDQGRKTTHQVSDIQGWHFIVANSDGTYRVNMPENMPADLMGHIEAVLDEYMDNADATSIDALNGEYITFFNLYTPDGKMMLCMRSREMVHSEFHLSLPEGEKTDIEKLCLMCRRAQEVIWNDGETRNEYDANSLIYDSRWHTGDVSSHECQSVDYFVSTPDPLAIDARWFESWAV